MVAAVREPTQVGRAPRELGIASIAAHSPQAKGRVERQVRTLQDRLVAELRLAGATSLDEANAVPAGSLPRSNGRFGVPAALEPPAYRPLAGGPTPGRSAACAPPAPSAAATPCASGCPGCSRRRGPATAPTPAAGSRAAGTSTAAAPLGIAGRARPPGAPRRRRARATGPRPPGGTPPLTALPQTRATQSRISRGDTITERQHLDGIPCVGV